MSFSKAKLKRFNDIGVATTCSSPSTAKTDSAAVAASGTPSAVSSTAASSSSAAQPERKEQIEKFFKDAVRFATSNKEAKEFAIPKEGSGIKEEKKSKGLRLFRTPSLPHRLRFRHHSDIASNSANNNNNAAGSSSSTASSTPLNHHHQSHPSSSSTTPAKDQSKSASRLKGKEALQQELRTKNELLDNYMSQIEVLKRHIDQLKENETQQRDEQERVRERTDTLIHELTSENRAHKQLNEQLSAEQVQLAENCARFEEELNSAIAKHAAEVSTLTERNDELRRSNEHLQQQVDEQASELDTLKAKAGSLQQEVAEIREKLSEAEQAMQRSQEQMKNAQNTNDALQKDLAQLKQQIEKDALAYAHETKITHNEMECLKKERNTLKHDLANKCELIRSLQEELLDKNCEIDAHCDNIRQLCRENAKYVERERLMDTAEQQVRSVEVKAAEKLQRLETELQAAIEQEKSYWRAELEKRQKLAEDEVIKIELEKQDVMVLLESTNDMLRERDEKIQKYEDQLRNGIDYYVQLTDSLQKQVVDLKQDMAKTITEKYNYQLTLSNTRATVNILMERLKKSDSDVEQLKAELESMQLAKATLEQSCLKMQHEMQTLRTQLNDSETALRKLQTSAKTLQTEVSVKESMFTQMRASEEDTLARLNKIASSFQERIDADAARYLELYNELRHKDEHREIYMQELKKALDDFANVLQFAQTELDSKDKALVKLREECDQLKLENISLKSKVDDNAMKKENSTDLEKIEDLLIDSELRAECEKITSWLLSSTEKSVRGGSTAEINELLKPTTPNNKTAHNCTTPVCNTSASKASASNSNPVSTPRSPRTPRTPHSPKTPHTPRTTPKKTVLFAGKENVPSPPPQKQVLKARNI